MIAPLTGRRPQATPENPAPEAVRCTRPGCHRRAMPGAFRERVCMGCRYPARYARDNLYRAKSAKPRPTVQEAAVRQAARAMGGGVTTRRLRVEVFWAAGRDLRTARVKLPAGTPVVLVQAPGYDSGGYETGCVVELACGGRCVIDPEFLAAAKEAT